MAVLGGAVFAGSQKVVFLIAGMFVVWMLSFLSRVALNPRPRPQSKGWGGRGRGIKEPPRMRGKRDTVFSAGGG